MRIINKVILFIVLQSICLAQNTKEYRLVEDILNAKSDFLSKRNQVSIKLSYIGEYKLSLKIMDSLRDDFGYKINKEDSIYLKPFHSVDAISYLTKKM